MIITISGMAGSGKTTVGKLLAEKLGYKFYDIGTLRKMAAKERKMTIEEYNEYGMSHPETDKDADAVTVRLGKTQEDFVMQGRVAYHFIPHSFKIYLSCKPDVAADRILKDNNNPERNSKSKTSTLSQVKKISVERDENDAKRYKKIYGIDDFRNEKNYDLVIDTSNLSATQVAGQILKKIGR